MINRRIFAILFLIAMAGIANADTMNLYPTYDAMVSNSTQATYTGIYNGVGDNYSDTDTYLASYLLAAATPLTNQYSMMIRPVLVYKNTSAASVTVTSAVLRTWATDWDTTNGLGETNYAVTAVFVDNTSQISLDDYDITRYGDSAISDYKIPVLGDAYPVNFTLTADGRTYIQNALAAGSAINLSLRSNWDISGTFNGTWSSEASSSMYIQSNESAHPPVLEITYSAISDPPVADFSKNGTYGNTGSGRSVSIAFTDTSTNSPTSWNWYATNLTPGNNTEFQFSTEKNPIHTFGSGNWTITLKATNAIGSGNSSVQYVRGLTIKDFPLSPANHIYRTKINTLPIDSRTSTYIATEGADDIMFLNPIAAINVVDCDQAEQQLTAFTAPGAPYAREVGIPIPIPDNLRIWTAGYDINWNIINIENGTIYEAFLPEQAENGTWSVWNSAHIGIDEYTLYNGGQSNSGLFMSPLMVTVDELVDGHIDHAIAAQMKDSHNSYIWPAIMAGENASTSWPPLGMRFRLNASYDISGHNAYQQTVLTALKEYGFILVDQSGADGYVTLSGELVDADVPQYAEIISALESGLGVTFENFEAVNESTLMVSADSGLARSGPPVSHFNLSIVTPTPTPTATATPTPTPTPSSEYGAGTTYGNYTIGGGAGYPTYSVSTADHVILSTADFVAHMQGGASAATSGQIVFIPTGTTIDLASYGTQTIPAGVTVASDRGYIGRAGATIKKTSGSDYTAMLTIGGNNVRVTGLVLEGPNPAAETLGFITWGIMNYGGYNGLVVDNNEIWGWSYAGVFSYGAPTTGRPWVHHNYIHHNQGDGYGYGVDVSGGDILVEANIFDYNRHSFTGDGVTGEKAEVRYNIHNGHGYYNGGSHFDVHENPSSTIGAGDYYLFHHNTVTYVSGLGTTVEPAFHIRDNPATGVSIYNNDVQTDWGGDWQSATEGLSAATDNGWEGDFRHSLDDTRSSGAVKTFARVTLTNNKWRGDEYPTATGILWLTCREYSDGAVCG